MEIFLFTISYFIIVATLLYLIYVMRKYSDKIKNQTTQINNIEKDLYDQLRNIQYKSKDISKYSKSLLKNKNSILSEFIPALCLTIFPFKKIKSLLFLNKLSKKFWFIKN